MAWENNGRNFILERPEGGFYLSYCPMPLDRDVAETAIVIINKRALFGFTHLILDGDWREPLEAAANHGGLAECVALYKANEDKWSPTSEYIPDLDHLPSRPHLNRSRREAL